MIIASVFGFSTFSLDVYYIHSSPREPRFVLVPLRFASEAWPRAGLGEPRSASNANKPASSWPLKQGRKSAQNMAAIEGRRDERGSCSWGNTLRRSQSEK